MLTSCVVSGITKASIIVLYILVLSAEHVVVDGHEG